MTDGIERRANPETGAGERTAAGHAPLFVELRRHRRGMAIAEVSRKAAQDGGVGA
jgi:hypothetical protein